jgi:hypothetical protein
MKAFRDDKANKVPDVAKNILTEHNTDFPKYDKKQKATVINKRFYNTIYR